MKRRTDRNRKRRKQNKKEKRKENVTVASWIRIASARRPSFCVVLCSTSSGNVSFYFKQQWWIAPLQSSSMFTLRLRRVSGWSWFSLFVYDVVPIAANSLPYSTMHFQFEIDYCFPSTARYWLKILLPRRRCVGDDARLTRMTSSSLWTSPPFIPRKSEGIL